MSEKLSCRAEAGGELRRIFPLVHDLFDYAAGQGLDEASYSEYANEDGRESPYAVLLPGKFGSLIEKYPGIYFLVAYADRRSGYYAAGTRERSVRLSTVKTRAVSEGRICEIDFTEPDSSKGSAIQVRVAESIKNQSFSRINQTVGTDIEQPYGRAEYMYELDPNGKELIRELAYQRLDEGVFAWKEQDRAVRWVRRLNMEKGEVSKVTYEDSYIIRSTDPKQLGEYALIKTTVTGELGHPQAIVVEIGSGSPSSGRVLCEDQERGMKIIEHEPIGAYKSQRKILEQDPHYTSWLAGKVDIEELLQSLRVKIEKLRKDWDKPSNIFERQDSALEGGNEKMLSH